MHLSLTILTAAQLATARILPRQSESDPVLMTQEAIDTYTRWTKYAALAYCSSTQLYERKADLLTAGLDLEVAKDDDSVARNWHVGLDTKSNITVIVHGGYGAGGSQINSLDTQTDLVLPSAELFPTLNSSARAHHGFIVEHSIDAQQRYESLARIEAKLGFYPPIYFIGHGPGASLALLDALSFRLRQYQTNGYFFAGVWSYGMPRVGNTVLIDVIDTWMLHVLRVVNKRDSNAAWPGRDLGYVHPLNERHLDEDGQWWQCFGRESVHPRCYAGLVTSVEEERREDHWGPYGGVEMKCDIDSFVSGAGA